MEIDVKSLYIQSDKTEEINSEVFSTDIDLMLYAPDKFSEDGFALMMADKNTGRVPIAAVSGLRDDEYIYTYSVTPQKLFMLMAISRKVLYARYACISYRIH